MTADPRPGPAERAFRWLLRLLPFDFRRNYGEEMADVFQDHHHAVRSEGRSALARLWMTTLRGMVRLASREHWAAWRQDLGYALRLFRRAPGFTIAALLSLALGIGANAAVFGIADAVFLNPLPIPEPDRAVSVFVIDQNNPGHTPLSTDNFLDVREQSTALTDVSAFFFVGARARIGSDPENLTGFGVTGSYFEALRVEAARGRVIGPDDDRVRGGHPVVVLSHDLWTRAFGADPAAIGETLSLNDIPFTIIGVTASSFAGTFGLFQPDFYVPLAMYDTLNPGTAWVDGRRWRWLNVIARLAPGVSIEEAGAATRGIGDRLAQAYPEFNEGRSLAVLPLAASVVNADQHDTLAQAWWILAGIVGALLLIACTNLANLLMARNAARAREIAVRLSLGASRARVARQLLTESLVLAIAGGILSLFLVYWLYEWLWSVRPPALTQAAIRPALDLTAVLFTFAVAAITALVFGVMPALQVIRTDLNRTLSDNGRTPGAAVRPRLRAALVASQVALATIALVVAGLFLGSLGRARQIDPGFDPDGLYATNYAVAGTNSVEQAHQRHRDLLERAARLPGVRAVAAADRLPVSLGNSNTIDRVFGSPVADQVVGTLVGVAEVSPGYFDTMGIPITAGRAFDQRDRMGSTRVVVVNRTMGERFWPGESALGKRFVTRVSADPLEVIGIAADSKYQTLGEAPQPFFYVPLLQSTSSAVGGRQLLMSTRAGSPTLAADVRALLREFDPEMPIGDLTPVSEQLGQALWAPRMLATTVTAFGVLALLLATAGIYGLLAVMVGQRRHEFGLRMTLGANGMDVLRLVVGRGMTWVGLGMVVGLAAAMPVIDLTRSLLFSPETLGLGAALGAVAVLATVALVACLVPARRAARVDPAVALRGGS